MGRRKNRILNSDSKAIIKYQQCSSDDSQPIVLYGLEGCDNFEPSQVIEGGLVCQSCGCHRNFHEKVNTLATAPPLPPPAATVTEDPSKSGLPPSSPPPPLKPSATIVIEIHSKSGLSPSLAPPPAATATENPSKYGLSPSSPSPSLPPPAAIVTEDPSKYSLSPSSPSPPLPPPAAPVTEDPSKSGFSPSSPPPPLTMITEDNPIITIVSPENDLNENGAEEVADIKRTRTKFTKDQKEQMEAFANYRLGWKSQGQSKDEISQFCYAIGVTKRAFQVWMSNKRSKMKVKKASS